MGPGTSTLVCRLLGAALLAIAVSVAPAARGASAPPTSPQVHVVDRGQTLAGIAKRYGVTVTALCVQNRIRPDRLIFPGQKLVVPGVAPVADATDPPAEPARRRVSTVREWRLRRDTTQPDRAGHVVLRGRMHGWSGHAVLRDGTVPRAASIGFERALASWRTGRTRSIDPRLIRLVSRVSDHFGGRVIVVVSGFRPPSKEQYTLRSMHNSGQAVDFYIPGVSNEAVRDFCRTLRGAGVGYYPNSSFVHLDSRGYAAYWVDFSGPGEAPRYATPLGRGRTHAPARRPSRAHPAAAPDSARAAQPMGSL
jgi:LysM repeat protein